MRNALGFFSGLLFVVLLAVGMDAHAQTEFDPVAWASSPEGIEQISETFAAGLIFPLMGYAIGFAAGALLRMIGGR